ncbi:hypothetical protein LSTR_LSTR011951 [Laodelphax striatellus]|uniref:Uncharacterized protein n=1 Tax=Laodelphax striatellus TaxID=195883 RepID=A0A482WZ55_LAOST|nr:hypothetical protein LSTR_LSTR011951 [Laodelphax striatellus]
MTLFLVISFLGVGVSSVISVSGHKWLSANILLNTGKEIDYYLEKNQIYGSIISPGFKAGSHLRVGQEWEEVIGDEKHFVVCHQLYEDGIYLDDYKPVIHFYENPPDVAYYGTFIHKQVWDCSSEKRIGKPEDHINFYRVVSVVHGVRPVNTVFYFDGIEIILDTTSYQSRQDHADIWTASFKEVKYIDPKTKKVLRYDGRLRLQTVDVKRDNVNPMNLFTPLDIFKESNFGDYTYEISESLGSIENNPKTVVIDTEGDILRVGKDKFTTLGRKEDKATCVFQLEEEGPVPHLYTDEYLPQCSIWKPKSRVYDSSYGGPVGKVSGNCFSVMNQELWKCFFETTETTKEGRPTTVQKTFHRRVTELVGAIPVSKVEYFGAVSVWKYKLNSKSSSVRIKEIYYYHQDNFHDQIRFNGAVTLKRPYKQEKIQKQEDAFFYKYNSAVISVYPVIIDGMAKKPVKERINPTYYQGGGGGGGSSYPSSRGSGLSWSWMMCCFIPDLSNCF